ncbi:MAG TPA: class I tRNA ligase family protein, partial [Cyclobacteriaceae bacterium]|nr:class I tRNA ligase family protein [Cyclobacteriaceae bacterium]
QVTYDKTVSLFETVLKVLHPFMPFITEELWHELKDRKDWEYIIVAQWPAAGKSDESILKEADFAFELITQIRNARSSKGLSPKEVLKLHQKEQPKNINTFWSIVKKLGNISDIQTAVQKPAGVSFLVGTHEFTIPLEGKIDVAKEREALIKDIEYQKGFMASVDKKLSNEKFVNSAKPEVVEMERKKKADAEAKIKALEESLSRL